MTRPWIYAWQTKRTSTCVRCGRPDARCAVLSMWMKRMWLPVCPYCVIEESMRTPIPETAEARP